MSNLEGWFELQTPQDLLKKLRHDLDRFEASSLDQYIAFDFFVTALHMVDWLYPDPAIRDPKKTSQNNRKQLVKSNTLLQVCSHLANGGKHFRATASHHTYISDVRRSEGAFQRDAFSSAFPTEELVIDLDGDAAKQYGSSILALELARKLYQFWEQTV